jgi:hypothetical protein
LSDWEKAFKFIKADGATSIGVALSKMAKEHVYAETLAIVTDEGENTAPYLRDALKEYEREMHIVPNIVIVAVNGSSLGFAKGLEQQGAEVMRYVFQGDYYGLTNVLPLLSAPTRSDLVELILTYELPKRPKIAGQSI